MVYAAKIGKVWCAKDLIMSEVRGRRGPVEIELLFEQVIHCTVQHNCRGSRGKDAQAFMKPEAFRTGDLGFNAGSG